MAGMRGGAWSLRAGELAQGAIPYDSQEVWTVRDMDLDALAPQLLPEN
jgi:hypothetical protein